MVWKPKEKQLSPEEAIDLAKKQLSPYWHESSPLFAAVVGDDGSCTVHPLDSEFNTKTWLIFFVDPTDFNGETTLVYARELYRRYHSSKVSFLAVMRPRYPFLVDREVTAAYMKRHGIPFPLVVDHEELISKAFGVSGCPATLFYDSDASFFKEESIHWIETAELNLQNYLRKTDPGLPLSPVYVLEQVCQKDVFNFEFGRSRGARFPTPGFVPGEQGFSVSEFPPYERPNEMTMGQILLSGKWVQDDFRIATSDPTATISFRCPSSNMSIIAQCPKILADPVKIVIEVNGAPLPDLFGAEDLRFDENGQSYVAVWGPKLYYTINRLPAKQREITIRFPTANEANIALYGIRFSEVF